MVVYKKIENSIEDYKLSEIDENHQFNYQCRITLNFDNISERLGNNFSVTSLTTNLLKYVDGIILIDKLFCKFNLN